MARPEHGLLRPLLLAVCCLFLLQLSECSRPSPTDHMDDARHRHQLLVLDGEATTTGLATSTEVAAGDAAAPSSASATTPARPVGARVASSRPRQTSDRALVVRAGTLLMPRSKLARRFLAAAGADDEAASATDGAAASCGTNNPHVNCRPPAWKP